MDEISKIEIIREAQISQSDNFINFKIILIGDSGVGKSSLLKRAVKNTFDDNYQATIGFEFLLLHFQVNELKIKFQIWDTCGQEMYRSLVQGFYHNSSLAVLVYDVSKKKSFESLDAWLQELRQHNEGDLPVFLVGNKNDLNKAVTPEEGMNFSKVNNIIYFTECSAKTGYKIKDIFFEAAKYLYHVYNKLKSENKIPITKKLKIDKEDNNDNNNNNKNKKKKCCK